jgi:hypothetical protein
MLLLANLNAGFVANTVVATTSNDISNITVVVQRHALDEANSTTILLTLCALSSQQQTLSVPWVVATWNGTVPWAGL